MRKYQLRGLLTVIICLVFIGHSFGQLNRRQLVGEWETNDKDSSYYTNEVIEFIQDANWRYSQQTCNTVILRISKDDFKLINTLLCSEPGSELWTKGRQSISVKRGKTKQILEIKILEKKETFEILEYEEESVDRYPWDIKKLKLRRL